MVSASGLENICFFKEIPTALNTFWLAYKQDKHYHQPATVLECIAKLKNERLRYPAVSIHPRDKQFCIMENKIDAAIR